MQQKEERKKASDDVMEARMETMGGARDTYFQQLAVLETAQQKKTTPKTARVRLEEVFCN